MLMGRAADTHVRRHCVPACEDSQLSHSRENACALFWKVHPLSDLIYKVLQILTRSTRKSVPDVAWSRKRRSLGRLVMLNEHVARRARLIKTWSKSKKRACDYDYSILELF